MAGFTLGQAKQHTAELERGREGWIETGTVDFRTLRQLTAIVERQEARIAELEAALEWRPIETAPKDGTNVNPLLIGWFALPGQTSMAVAFWHSGHKAWCHTNGLFTNDPNRQPTHWMRAPAPPPTETAGE